MHLDSDPAQPLPPLRRAVVVAGSKATKVILAMLGVWVRVRGWDNVESGRRQHAVVIFNHVSFVSVSLHESCFSMMSTLACCVLPPLLQATKLHCTVLHLQAWTKEALLLNSGCAAEQMGGRRRRDRGVYQSRCDPGCDS